MQRKSYGSYLTMNPKQLARWERDRRLEQIRLDRAFAAEAAIRATGNEPAYCKRCGVGPFIKQEGVTLCNDCRHEGRDD